MTAPNGIMLTHWSIDACELKNKVLPSRGLRLIVAFAVAVLLPAMVAAQEHQPPAPAETHAATTEHAEPGDHAEEHSTLAGLLWPTANFIILAGGLWWFLKDPFAAYLRDRHAAIRKDLVDAAHIKSSATADLAEIDRKLAALPGEIEALRRRGSEEIEAEEHRIASHAAAERDRLLEQTRREIDLQLRLAKRELTAHATNLAVQVAGERLQQTMTADDQQRLVDRYLDQVTARPS